MASRSDRNSRLYGPVNTLDLGRHGIECLESQADICWDYCRFRHSRSLQLADIGRHVQNLRLSNLYHLPKLITSHELSSRIPLFRSEERALTGLTLFAHKTCDTTTVNEYNWRVVDPQSHQTFTEKRESEYTNCLLPDWLYLLVRTENHKAEPLINLAWWLEPRDSRHRRTRRLCLVISFPSKLLTRVIG